MSEQRRILIIDDDRAMAESLLETFAREGYAVRAEFDGPSAIAALRREEFDVVIVDLELRDASGAEVAAYVDRAHPHAATIVFTDRASAESAVEAIHHHVFDYVVKPFQPAALLRIVEKAFAKIEGDRLREDMVSMLVHDIKIPLTSILGFSQMMAETRDGQPHPKSAAFAASIYRNGQKILTLIDNYLTSCRIEASGLSLCLGEVRIEDVIDDVLASLRCESEQHHRRLITRLESDLPPIRADGALLYRAVGNIALNAIRYSPANARIEVRARRGSFRMHGRERQSVCVEVSNPGPGIAPDALPHVFDRYKRATNLYGIEGSGIGLYVVKAIADAHDGLVEAESIPGEITTFRLTLPLEGPDA
ncbi:MAG: Non-motile and phage-resistance protein [candidate division BRC1 bacterium ADurb.BinA364]|nr:MAG: Non-motile and phage-resistance protein [candidate division BRC1 bacterium ADurb.BinA364]